MRTSVAATARRLLRWEFLPEAVLLAGLSIFFLDQTDAATSAFKSSKALAIIIAVTTGWLAARVALARLLPIAVARAAVFSVAAAMALAVVVLPAYDNETVIEAFPTAVAAPAPAATPVPGASPSTALPAQTSPAPKAPVTTSTTRRAVAPPAASVAAPASIEPEPTTSTTLPATEPASPDGVEPAPAASQPAPERLRSGPIRGIDHRASGTAAIYRQPDGRYVVGLEDIDIQPGPDYDLYIVPGEGREDTKGGIRLGDLRGNKGTQFYEVPEGVDLANGPWTVLVWCQTFAVPVAGATPS